MRAHQFFQLAQQHQHEHDNPGCHRRERDLTRTTAQTHRTRQPERCARGDIPHFAVGGEDQTGRKERDTGRDRFDHAQRIDPLGVTAEIQRGNLLTQNHEKAGRNGHKDMVNWWYLLLLL